MHDLKALKMSPTTFKSTLSYLITEYNINEYGIGEEYDDAYHASVTIWPR